jgi:hypothetical protein
VANAGTLHQTSTAAAHAQAVAGWYLSTQRGESTYFSITNRFETIHLAAAADGTLSMGSMTLVETSPWVFQKVSGPNVVSAVADGGHVRWIMVNGAIAWDRTSAWSGPLVWVPLVGAGALLLILATLAWPLAAGARRLRHRRLDQPRLDSVLRLGMPVDRFLVVHHAGSGAHHDRGAVAAPPEVLGHHLLRHRAGTTQLRAAA